MLNAMSSHLRLARRRKVVLALVSACVLLLALPISPARAFAHVEVAELSGVSATFTYQLAPNQYGGESASGLTLAISRSGSVVYSAPISSKWCEMECRPPFVGPDVHIATLEPGQGPQVVLDLFTGGAHCCFVEQIFSGPGPNGVTVAEHNFRNAPVHLEPLGSAGESVLVSADNRFAYAFTNFADSGLPVQVWTLRDGVFSDVTRDYPSLIATDAVKHWRYFKARRNDDVGFFAAWAADEELLGRETLVNRTLAHELHARGLRAFFGPEHGRRFARDLKTDLRRWGYARTRVPGVWLSHLDRQRLIDTAGVRA
jgi:hypothetical protein